MIRTIDTDLVIRTIKEMCIEANYSLSEDMKQCLKEARQSEQSELGTKILDQLADNLEIAEAEMIPNMYITESIAGRYWHKLKAAKKHRRRML